MNKFHVNPDTGEVGKCDAKIKCGFLIPENEHFETKQDAESFYADRMRVYETENVPKIIREISANSAQSTNMTDAEIIDTYKKMVRGNTANKDQLVIIAMKECVRQHVGFERLETIINGHNKLQEALDSNVEITSEFIEKLGGVVEPDNHGRFRVSPVTFQNGGTSANSQDIPRLMHNLFTYGDALSAEEFAKEYLWIHPFIDGNGRSGWLIYNWKNNTLNNPVELPKFFGEN